MIRKDSLVSRIRAVWSQDPALDKEHPGFSDAWEAYIATANPEKLPVKDGQKLTIFECSPMTRTDWNRTDRLEGKALADVIVAYTLQRVENYMDKDGTPVEIDPSDRVRDGASKHLRPEVLDKLYDVGVFDDVASMVHRHSRLDPTRGQD